MNNQIETKLSKYLCLLLRHRPDKANLTMDEYGWVHVDELIRNIKDLSINNLNTIVKNDTKDRYSFNEDKSKIRCNQGHSVNVDVGLEEKIPPKILYHGTATKYVDSILSEGIKSQTRQYVHLSDNLDTAISVGKRHGTAIVLEINTEEMLKNNHKFYISKNGVWLTKFIEPKYIMLEKLD